MSSLLFPEKMLKEVQVSIESKREQQSQTTPETQILRGRVKTLQAQGEAQGKEIEKLKADNAVLHGQVCQLAKEVASFQLLREELVWLQQAEAERQRKRTGREKVQLKIEQEEKQHAAYEIERQKKLAEEKALEEKVSEQVGEFLKYVMEGDQDKAEVMLKEKPSLALKKGIVTDLSKREFKHITGFQYAVWALDWHMWQMLLKYMSKEAAALQFAELEEKGTAHGKHFSLVPLIEALDTHLKNYSGWDSMKCETHWRQEVGGNQLLLPAHVVNEYCHPSRSFVPCPGFKEEALPRSMEWAQGRWFTATYNEGKLGEKFSIIRYNGDVASSYCGQAVNNVNYYWVTADTAALQSLWKMRQQQFEDLRVELQYLFGVKGLLNAYFPPVLSSTVLGYLS